MFREVFAADILGWSERNFYLLAGFAGDPRHLYGFAAAPQIRVVELLVLAYDVLRSQSKSPAIFIAPVMGLRSYSPTCRYRANGVSKSRPHVRISRGAVRGITRSNSKLWRKGDIDIFTARSPSATYSSD